MMQTYADNKGVKLDIRWMVRSDMNEVFSIESEVFEFPWSEEDFTRCLRHQSAIGKVCVYEAQAGPVLLGFMVYEIRKQSLDLLNIAVDPLCRLRGVGRAMMERMKHSLRQERDRITTCVRESNLDALLFFKANGFRAVSIKRDYYDDCDDDSVQMEYQGIVNV